MELSSNGSINHENQFGVDEEEHNESCFITDDETQYHDQVKIRDASSGLRPSVGGIR